MHDSLKQGLLQVESLRLLVIEEVEEIVSREFEEPIRDIFTAAPSSCWTVLVGSCSISLALEEAQDLLGARMKDFVVLETGKITQRTLPKLMNFYTLVDNDDAKPAALRNYLETENVRHGVIYCNTQSTSTAVKAFLLDCGYAAECLEASAGPDQIKKTIEGFHTGCFRYLVTVDESNSI